MTRLPVKKTYKLFIGGGFPRSESGRTYDAEGQNVARASRKDARDAVVAARKAQPGWASATAYNRGQVLYRLAEMMETRTADLAAVCSGKKEVEAAIDRVVWANTFNRFDPASPFGGYKESGFGREGGRHGLEPYLSFEDGK